MPDARWNWSWSEWNVLDGCMPHDARPRCPGLEKGDPPPPPQQTLHHEMIYYGYASIIIDKVELKISMIL